MIPPQILSPVVFYPQLQSHFSISTCGCHRYYKLKVSKVNTFSPFPISTYFPSTILFKNNNESVPPHPKQNKNNLALSSINTHWDGAKHLKGYSFGVAESHSLDGVKVFPTIDVLQVFWRVSREVWFSYLVFCKWLCLGHVLCHTVYLGQASMHTSLCLVLSKCFLF